MLFRALNAAWADPWVVHHRGSYWLYHVVEEGGAGVALGLWRSEDGTHWSDLGRVLARSEGAHSLGAGAVWRASTFERDGRFLLGFTERRGSAPARSSPAIHMAESTDLVHWRRLGPEYLYPPDPRWYRVEGRTARWSDFATVPRGAGGRYGYCSADLTTSDAGLGFGESLDSCHWRALPPPRIAWGERAAPPALRLSGVTHAPGHYLAFIEGSQATHGRRDVCALVSQAPGGPFVPAPRNYRVLSTTAPAAGGLEMRLVETDGERLVSHVATTRHGKRWLAPLKRLRVAEDGSAWLAYWPGNDSLRGEAIDVTLPESATAPGERSALPGRSDSAPPAPTVTMLAPRLDAGAGVILEGRWSGLPTQASDVFRGGGLYLEAEEGRGTGILVPMAGQALAGPMGRHSNNLTVEDAVDRELPRRSSCTFRLLLRGELAELYVDDLLMCIVGLPAPASGHIGLVTAGQTQAGDLRACRLNL